MSIVEDEHHLHLSKGLCTGLALQKTRSFQKHPPLPSAADLTHARTAQALQAPPPPQPPQGPSRVGIAVLLGAGLLLLATWHKLTSRSSASIYADALQSSLLCIRASLSCPASDAKQSEAGQSMFKAPNTSLQTISIVWIKLHFNLAHAVNVELQQRRRSSTEGAVSRNQ